MALFKKYFMIMQMNYFLKNWLNKVAEDVKENSGDITKKLVKPKQVH